MVKSDFKSSFDPAHLSRHGPRGRREDERESKREAKRRRPILVQVKGVTCPAVTQVKLLFEQPSVTFARLYNLWHLRLRNFALLGAELQIAFNLRLPIGTLNHSLQIQVCPLLIKFLLTFFLP